MLQLKRKRIRRFQINKLRILPDSTRKLPRIPSIHKSRLHPQLRKQLRKKPLRPTIRIPHRHHVHTPTNITQHPPSPTPHPHPKPQPTIHHPPHRTIIQNNPTHTNHTPPPNLHHHP